MRHGLVYSLRVLVGSFLCLAIATPLAGAAQASHVAVVEVDPATYTPRNAAAREDAAKKFYEKHRDGYDFLVFFPAFPVDLSTQSEGEVLGWHLMVRNAVRGIGHQTFDNGAFFGSTKQLKGVIDIHSLVPAVELPSAEQAIATLAHEVGHQWSAKTSFIDPVTRTPSGALLGPDGAHWAYTLSSDASVMYGSRWTAQPDGTFVATESRKRYSPLDLYLMGILGADEVPPFTLIEPAAGAVVPANGLPPANGTTLSGTGKTISIGDVVAAEGARLPAVAGAQKLFRAAFVILVPAGQLPTAEQSAFVDGVRREWVNQFFFMTRGRALMETDLVEVPPGAVEADPNVGLGIGYLVANQRGDGTWADAQATVIRETAMAVEALKQFPANAGAAAALVPGTAALAAFSPADTDSRARRGAALAVARGGSSDSGLSARNADGGLGLAEGYRSTVIDSALAALALSSDGRLSPVDPVVDYLLGIQGADGGWPYLPGGESGLEPTAWILRALATLPRDQRLDVAVEASLTFLGARRQPDGSYADDLFGSATFTAEAVLALDALGVLGTAEASATATALLAGQLPDGSWNESIYETGLALKALRLLQTPNLVIESARLSKSIAWVGDPVSVRVRVRNVGRGPASRFPVRAFGDDGKPCDLLLVEVEALAAGAFADLDLPLITKLGNENLFLVADPDDVIDETREDDNRRVLAFRVASPPVQPDLYVAGDGAVLTPSSLDKLPATVHLSVVVGNAGQTPADRVEVVATVRGVPVATWPVNFAARTYFTLNVDIPVAPGPGPVDVGLAIDPGNQVVEADESNNAFTYALPVAEAVDLAVGELRVTPSQVDQGQLVSVTHAVVNNGSLGANAVTETILITDEAGLTVATLETSGISLPPGASLARERTWKATVAGSLSVRVEVSHPLERDPSDNATSVLLRVLPSSLPNLRVGVGDVIVAPSPARQGGAASAQVVVRNTGSIATGPFQLALFVGEPSPQGLVKTFDVASLAGGASATLETPIPVHDATDLVVIARADPGDVVKEFDESDNEGVVTVPVLSLPDLALDDGLIVPSKQVPREGELVSVSVTVVNSGGQSSEAFRLDLHDGEPAAGGVLIGSTSFDSLEAGGVRSATFQWNPVTQGAHSLIASLGGAGAADGDPSNNRAERLVPVQNADFAITNPFFSPNGDGVKDDTAVAFRISEPRSLILEIRDTAGALTRTIEVPAPIAGGEIKWDGRDESSVVAADGEYSLSLRTVADIPVTVGTAVAVLDVNRSQVLDAAGTAMIQWESFLGRAPGYWGGEWSLTAMADDSGVMSFGCDGTGWCGIYSIGAGDLSVKHLSPDGQISYPVLRMAVSPDGDRIAFVNQPEQLWLLTVSQQTLEPLDTSGVVNCAGSLAFSPDGRELVFETLEGIAVRDLTTGAQRIIHPRAPEFAFSPDGEWISVVGWLGDLRLLRRDGTGERLLLPEYSLGYPTYSPGRRHDWLAGSREIAFGHWMNGVSSVDVETLSIRRIFVEADPQPYSQQFGDYARVAAGASGRAVGFGFQPGGFEGASTQVLAAESADLAPRLLFDPSDRDYFYFKGLSPLGTVALVHDEGPTGTIYRGPAIVSTLANLSARIAPTRRPGEVEMSFYGTAADLNLESFVLGVRKEGTPDAPRVIASSTVPVVDALLATWVPPAEGIYEALLTVSDKAGNTRTRTARFAWSNTPAISNVTREPEYISPNGDGVQDSAVFRYSVSKPVTTELVVTDGMGSAIRHIPVTHLAAGVFESAWDGMRDDGYVASDGVYQVGLNGIFRRVVVDTVRPEVELALLDRLPPMGSAEFALVHVTGVPHESGCSGGGDGGCLRPWSKRDCCKGECPTAPQIALNISRRASDVNLLSWFLEDAERVWDRGVSQVEENQQAPIYLAKGKAFRLRAVDLAGNEAVTAPLAPTEKIFALGAADWELLDECRSGLAGIGFLPHYRVTWQILALPAHAIVDKSLADGKELVYELPLSDRMAIPVDSGISSEVVAWTVAYRAPGKTTWATSPGIGRGQDGVWWDPPPDVVEHTEVRVRVKDVGGREFETQSFILRRGSPPGGGNRTCAGVTAEGDSYVVKLNRPFPEMQSQSWTFTPLDSMDYARHPAPEVVTWTSESEFRIPKAEVPGCRYAVEYSGDAYLKGPDGTPTLTGLKYEFAVSLCAFSYLDLRLEGRVASLIVTEGFPKPIRNVSVYVGRDSQGLSQEWVAETGPFDGVSPLVKFDASALPRGVDLPIRLLAQFEDGSRAEATSLEFDNCNGGGLPPLHLPPMQVSVGPSATQSVAPQPCTPTTTIQKVPIEVTTTGKLAALTATLRTLEGVDLMPLVPYAWAPGDKVVTAVTFTTAGLPVGSYEVHVDAADTDGFTAEGRGGRVIVEHEPPVVAVSSPGPSALVCPVQQTLSDGSVKRSLIVSGLATDATLQQVRVLVRSSSESVWTERALLTGQSLSSGSLVGTLATLDVSGWSSGDYVMRLEARDLGGLASCTPEIPFHLDNGVAVARLGADPALFSPDSDGAMDATSIAFALTEPATVGFALDQPGLTVPSLPTGNYGLGDSALAWNGRGAGDAVPKDGVHTVYATATDACGGVAQGSARVTLDTVPPAIVIESPAPGAVLAASVSVLGSVQDLHLSSYRLSLGEGASPASYVVFAEGTASTRGVLGMLPLVGLPGVHTLLVEAWDAVGHASTERVTFDWAPGAIIESLAVAPLYVSPNGDGVQDSATARVALFSAAQLTVELLRPDGQLAAGVVANKPSDAGVSELSLAGALVGLPDGRYVVRAKALAGGAEDMASQPLVVDNKPPEVVFASPSIGEVVPGAVGVSASIADENMDGWQLKRRVGADEILLREGAGSDPAIAQSLAELPEGGVTLVAVGRDLAGNRREVAVPFISDVTAPVPSITWPLAGQYVSSRDGLAFVTGSVIEANPESWRLEISDPAVPEGRRVLASGSGNPGDTLLHAWDVSVEADGPATLRLVALDRAGHEASVSVEVIIDDTAPAVAITAPRDTFVSSDEPVLGSVADEHLVSWQVELSDGLPGSAFRFVAISSGTEPVAGSQLARIVGQLPDGMYTLRLTATDEAGNVGTNEAAFEVDRTPPAPPLVVAVALKGIRDGLVTWTPSPDEDVVGYRLIRASGGGGYQPVGPTMIQGLEYLDQGLNDGLWRYEVIAIDRAGLESVPSEEASLIVDTRPPLATISRPTTGARVHGAVDVIGTASSTDDFKVYRLSVGAGGAPASFTPLRVGTAPVVANLLGVLDTTSHPEGATLTVRLEAEDLRGNVAEAQTVVIVDNEPPPAPVLVSVAGQGPDVLVKWTEVAASDLAGYLVYRNGLPLNGSASAVFENPVAFVLPPGTTQFTDIAVPDGTFEYRVQAVDTASNLSAFSNALSITLERRTPRATIATPAHLARVGYGAEVLAVTVDEDVVSVQIEARSAANGGVFMPVGPLLNYRPWKAVLDPSAFASVIELRARATDAAGKTDSSPESIFVFRSSAPSAPLARALVDESLVTVDVVPPVDGGAVLGYRVESAGYPLNGGTPGGFAAATASTNTANAGKAMDGNGGTYWAPTSPTGQWWQGTLDAERLLDAIRINGSGTFDIQLRTDGAWVPVARSVAGTSYGSVEIAPPLAADAVRIVFVGGSPARLYEVVPGTLNLSALPVADDLSWAAEGTYAYLATAIGKFGETSAAQVGARVYAPVLDDGQAVVTVAERSVAGGNATPGAVVTVSVNGVEAGTGVANGEGRFSVPVLLTTGGNDLMAQAVDGAGNRSRVSAPVSVWYEPPPQATLALALEQVSGSDVHLAFTAAGDLGRIAHFEFLRSATGVEKIVGSVGPGDRVFVDRGVPNGAWTYVVRAVNSDGAAGTPSNVVVATVSVAVPAAPVLALAVPPIGGALDLSWAFVGAASFQLERAAATADFTVVAAGLLGASYRDGGLANGLEYRYRLSAVDAAGNVGPPSNVVAGTPVDTVKPAAPRIDAPTVPGAPVTLYDPMAVVAGSAEPGVRVELFQNGRYAGQDLVDEMGVTPSAIPLVAGAYGAPDVHPSGEPVVVATSAAGAYGIAFVWPSTGAESSIPLPTYPSSAPALSPDGKTAAVFLYQAGFGLFLADSVAGSLTPALPAVPGSAWDPVWSRDGSLLAYVISRGVTGVAVLNVATGSEQVFVDPLGGASRLRWLDDSHIGYVNWYGELARISVLDGSREVIATRSNIYAWAADSATGGVALSGSDDLGTARTWIVRGGQTVATLDFVASSMAFALDGRSLAMRSWDGTLAMAREPWGGLETVGAVSGVSSLAWLDSGALMGLGWGSLSALEIEGRFEVPVRLESGANTFVAVALDDAGLRSGPSDAIEVTLDAEALPDLAITAAVQPGLPVVGDAAVAVLKVRNLGAASAGGKARIVLEKPDGSISEPPGATIPALASGASATIVFGFAVGSLQGNWRLIGMVDPAAGESDRDLTNNQSVHPFFVGSGAGLSLSLTAKPGDVPVDGQIAAVATLVNAGPSAQGTLTFTLEDAAGIPAVTTPAKSLALAGTAVRVEGAALSSAGLLAGGYRVRATFTRASGESITESVPVALLAETSATLRLEASRAEYAPTEPIDLASFVTNASRNAPLSGAQLVVEVRDAAKAIVWTATPHALPMIWLGGEVAKATTIPAGLLAAGTFEARAIVSLDGAELAVASATFSVAAEPLLVGQIDVAATGSPPVVKRGAPLPVTVTARNAGTGTALGVVARLVVVDAAGVVVAMHEVQLGDLAPQASNGFAASLRTDPLALGLYGLALTATHDGRTESIATGRFRVADGMTPTLAFLNLTAGMFVRQTATVRVQANDDASGVAAVSAAIGDVSAWVASGGTPLALESGNAIAGIWKASLVLPAEGPNTVRVSARDVEGNDGLLSPGPLNPIEVTVIRDTIPPELSIAGIAEGALVNHAVIPVVTATDLHLAGVEAWLDGASHAQGAAVTVDGNHVLRATATDRAGNSTNAGVRFTIDQSPPSIVILGVGAGAYSALDVTPRIVVLDAHLEGYTATLDGVPFVEGTVLSEERGYLLAVDAKDLAGNVATEQFSFTIDKTAPAITITGVSEGEWLALPAVPDVAFSDANLASAEVALDGTPWLPGTPVAVEGEHVLTARAVDKAGNRAERAVRFFVDTTPPLIAIEGVSEGDLVNHAVTPVVTVTEANPGASETQIDGVVALPGAAVSTEGPHVVHVTASDLAGNVAAAQVTFEIDTTPPLIQVSVENGATYSSPLSIAFAADDLHLGDVIATLDGAPFASGGVVETGGPHVLLVTASDFAGNTAERKVEFGITDSLRADLAKERLARSSNVLAWVSDGCRTTGAKAAQIRGFIVRSLPAGTVVEFPGTALEFRRRLRSGEFGVFVVASADRGGSEQGDGECGATDRDDGELHADHVLGEHDGDKHDQGEHDEGEHDEGEHDDSCETACDRLDSITARELREAVFRGAGLIVLKRTPSELPDLREALGIHFEGQEKAEVVRLVQSAFTDPGLLAVDGGIELDLEGGAPVGWFGEEDDADDDVAVSTHRFGLGEGLVFGFDLSAALPQEVASATFAAAVAFAAGEAELLPAGVVGIEIRVQNRGGAAGYKVVEALDAGLQVVRVLDSGTTTGPLAIEWSGELAVDELETLRYFVKLPSVAGAWQTRSSLFLGSGSSTRPVAEATLTLLLAGDRTTLLASVEGAVQRLPTAKADGERRRRLLGKLAEVAAIPGVTSAEREHAIEILLDAAGLASKIETADPTEARVAIDRLLAWWEMKP